MLHLLHELLQNHASLLERHPAAHALMQRAFIYLVRGEVESDGGPDARVLETMEVLPLPTTEVYNLCLTWALDNGAHQVACNQLLCVVAE
jgi:hypothetical protein